MTFCHRLWRRLAYFGGDYRSRASRDACSAVLDQRSDARCISIGGGPGRCHPSFLNLNVGRFPNVDVVGDAHALPCADDAIDAIFCEAVLEHLEFPSRAVAEMFRALRPGGQVYAATPFLQSFHGYPNHFQNFTLIGHRKLFEHAGFTVLSSGVCVGPTFALGALISQYLRQIVRPKFLGLILSAVATLAALFFRPLDLLANRLATAHFVSSSTFVHALKPPRSARENSLI